MFYDAISSPSYQFSISEDPKNKKSRRSLLFIVNLCRDFVDSVLVELRSMWPAVRTVHGKPIRHSRNQGPVERANIDIDEILGVCKDESNIRDWLTGINFIQFKKILVLHFDK